MVFTGSLIAVRGKYGNSLLPALYSTIPVDDQYKISLDG